MGHVLDVEGGHKVGNVLDVCIGCRKICHVLDVEGVIKWVTCLM